MPRQARLDAPGALHYVMSRGIEQWEPRGLSPTGRTGWQDWRISWNLKHRTTCPSNSPLHQRPHHSLCPGTRRIRRKRRFPMVETDDLKSVNPKTNRHQGSGVSEYSHSKRRYIFVFLLWRKFPAWANSFYLLINFSFSGTTPTQGEGKFLQFSNPFNKSIIEIIYNSQIDTILL